MPPPKISVILPTYSRRHVLPRTIASVLAQDEKDFELIIVDDCSTDDTGAYLASLGDPRIAERGEIRAGIVGRAVVDDDQFEIFFVLRQNARNRARQDMPAAIGRQDH